MTVLPETLLPSSLGRGWINLDRRQSGGTRSYVHDGRVVHCMPCGPVPLAVDAESVDAQAAGEISARYALDVAEFLMLWTRAEVAAKLLRRSSLLAFREQLAEHPQLSIRSDLLDGLVISVGWRAVEAPSSTRLH